ncbi:hypothetical protein [Agrococcus beijingensis]|uniref:hypothetical protein n=1 Tax=Agrococcus beijingensis TaxID=3068634 RepID=UPI00274176FB|nr:hypothetical protein [Agrococcus sp. REN33]
MDEAQDPEALLRDIDRLRGELTRLERERAVERGELRSAVARAAALQAELEQRQHPLRAQRSLVRRGAGKAYRIARRVARRLLGA